jgi:phage FluMu protein Com
VLIWLIVMAATDRKLSPKQPAKGGDTSRFKFMHCDNDSCRLEMAYNKDMDGKRCPKCQPPKEGYMVGSETSIKGATQLPPMVRVYVALFVETVLMMGVLTYLMYREVPDPGTQYFVIACPFCNQRLRYRAVSHGGQGACPKCKRIIRFPDQEDAVTEEEVYRADAAAAAARAAAAEADAEH